MGVVACRVQAMYSAVAVEVQTCASGTQAWSMPLLRATAPRSSTPQSLQVLGLRPRTERQLSSMMSGPYDIIRQFCDSGDADGDENQMNTVVGTSFVGSKRGPTNLIFRLQGNSTFSRAFPKAPVE